MFSWWDLILKIVPQAIAAEAAITARGGHGTYVIDLAVVDKATGQDIIPDIEVAEVTL